MADRPKIEKPHPIGTVKKIREAGLDTRNYFACSAREDGVNPCPHWDDCVLRGGEVLGYDFSDHVIRGESGPEFIAIATMAKKSSGKKIVKRVCACYELPLILLKAENSRHGDAPRFVKIIAMQGEEIRVGTRGPVDENVPGVGMRRTWHPVRGGQPTIVPIFPAPMDNPELFEDQDFLMEQEKFHQRDTDRLEREFYGPVKTSPKKEKAAKGVKDDKAGASPGGPATTG